MQRSATEHLLTWKSIKERTFSVEKKEFVHMLLLDMRTVLTAHLIKDLQHTVEAHKIHIIYQLLNVTLSAKC